MLRSLLGHHRRARSPVTALVVFFVVGCPAYAWQFALFCRFDRVRIRPGADVLARLLARRYEGTGPNGSCRVRACKQCAVNSLPEGYHLRAGKTQDRALLRRFLQELLGELGETPEAPGTIDNLLARVFDARRTPLWWAMRDSAEVGCLWLGRAWDQFSGAQSTYVHLLYVRPEHRRRGIGRFLLDWASEIARTQGDSQLLLQSLPDNTAALGLYAAMGFQTRALFLSKPL